jgi:hypothetical protein
VNRLIASAFSATVALTLVGCGTTVSQQSVAQGGGSGLGGPSSSAGVTGSDSVLTGASGATTGLAGASGSAATAAGGAFGSSADAGAIGQPGGSTAGGASKSPLSVGILVTKCSNCDLLGAGFGSTAHSEQDIWTAMVKAVNARGGILGRKVQPVWGVVDTANSDWNAMFQSVCATFTQDHKVADVIGASFVVNQNFAKCLAKRNIPWFNGVPTVGANGSTPMLQQLPYVLPSVPPDDMVQLLAYTSGVTDGWLKPSTRLGVLRDTCGPDVTIWNGTVLPYLRSQHITVTDDEAGPCTGGAQDQGAAASFEQSALLRMRSAGVDTVAAFGIPLVLFIEDAESQHWYPKYLTSGGMAAFEQLLPADQLVNVHTAGWMPWLDVDRQPPMGAPQKSCLAELRSGGVTPSGTETPVFYSVCAGEWLYEQTLQQSAGITSAAAVMAALSALGTKAVNPLVMNNATSFTSTKHTGPVVYRTSLYLASCSCSEYVGPLRPLPHT